MVGFLSYFWIPKPSRFLCLQVFYAFELVLSIFELKKIVHLYHISLFYNIFPTIGRLNYVKGKTTQKVSFILLKIIIL
jgi:hypothetical protein